MPPGWLGQGIAAFVTLAALKTLVYLLMGD